MSQTNPTNRSRVSFHVLFCCLPQVLLGLLLAAFFGGGLWFLLPLGFMMIVVPSLDTLTGWQDDRAFEKEDFSPLQIAILHWNTRLYTVFYMAAVVYGAWQLPHFTKLEAGLLIANLSLLAGVAFSAAHELLHCKEAIDQRLQRFVTSFLFYPHYKLIHVQSHHAHAATEEDKNTAWLNETIFAYIARTIPQSFIRCWQLETQRLNSRKLPFWQRLIQNRINVYAAGQVMLLLAFWWLTGLWGLLFFVAHIAGAHVVLESVNYIQHYGLLRRKAGGEYEKTGAEHSWDSYHFFSSYVAFRVGHHSFHHLSVKPYYLLAVEREAPKLPTGYFWALGMVFVPPVWRRVMNPKIGAAV